MGPEVLKVATARRDPQKETAVHALFESKLHPPPARAAVVPREALVDRLVETGDVPITSVVAPPGYGKTTLLAEWAHREDTRIAWLSIDRLDNDLSQFVSYAVAALDRVEPLEPTLLDGTTRQLSVARAASRVAGAMASMKQPITLVLDNVESLYDAACLDTVAELALHLPSGTRLAVATRADPPLPVPRLRAARDIVEIGVDELTLNDREARRLLEEAGVRLDNGDLDLVLERAEGWPVGLYLAALALKAGGSGELVGVPFTGDDRLVAEYLRSEVLNNLSSDEVRFLTRTSVVDRLSGQLCDALLDSAGSAEVLESLAHANLLLIPLDRRGEWYRYHHLLRDLLRAELSRREPEVVSQLHLRASEWFDGCGLPELAIDHAEAGNDADRANELLVKHAPALYATGRMELTNRWMRWFDDRGLVDQYPALAVCGALLFSGNGRMGDAERWASAAEAPQPTASRRGHEFSARFSPKRIVADGSTLASWLAVLRLVSARDGVDAVHRDAEIALSGLNIFSGLRAPVVAYEALAYLAVDDLVNADALMTRAVTLSLDNLRIPPAAIAYATRGLIAVQRDQWSLAASYSAEAMRLVTAWALDDYMESVLGYILEARVAIHGGSADRAAASLRSAARLRPLLTYGRPLLSVVALLELARAYAALGDTAGAREVIRQSREVLEQRPDLGMLPGQLDVLSAALDTMKTTRFGASSLTTAELRVVPFLPTHLTFAQIAERLHVSRNTAKTQAISIYQKLGVSSRGGAVEQLGALGLLES